MKKAVLVDFDGVILRNNVANKYISSRIKTYVSRKLHTDNANIIERFAEKVYRDHGHTEQGMTKHGYVTSLTEFNYHVYDSYDAKMQYSDIVMTSEEKDEWCKFRDVCDSRGVEVLIYSNASLNWVKNFINTDDDKSTLLLCEYLESFRHTSDNILKPSKMISTIVTNFVKEKHTHAFFIDDSLNNLSMVTRNSFYTRVWFDNSIDSDSAVLLNEGLYVVNTLDKIADIL